MLSIKISLWLLRVTDRQKVTLNDEAAHHQTVFTAHLSRAWVCSQSDSWSRTCSVSVSWLTWGRGDGRRGGSGGVQTVPVRGFVSAVLSGRDVRDDPLGLTDSRRCHGVGH